MSLLGFPIVLDSNEIGILVASSSNMIIFQIVRIICSEYERIRLICCNNIQLCLVSLLMFVSYVGLIIVLYIFLLYARA